MAVTSGDGQVTLDWTEPELNGSGAIDFYTVSYVDDAGVTQSIEIDAPTTTATITGLTNGNSYTFSVTATNENELTSIPATIFGVPLGARQIDDSPQLLAMDK